MPSNGTVKTKKMNLDLGPWKSEKRNMIPISEQEKRHNAPESPE
jgi:hypothetical protein